MKQFALAVANYSAAHDQRLPPTAMEFFASGRRPLREGWSCSVWVLDQSPSWRVAVLPYLEEQSIYDQIDFSKGILTETNIDVLSHVLPTFQCPSTPGYPRSVMLRNLPRTVSDWSDMKVGSFDYGVPRNNINIRRYSPNDEHALPPAWMGAKDPLSKLAWRWDWRGETCPFAREFGSASLRWVTDGLSKTTVAHEIAYQPNFYSRKGLDGKRNDEGEPLSGKIHLRERGSSWGQMDVYNPGVANHINEGNAEAGRFAFHPEGVNNAFLDGSVRFLAESTDLLILKAIVTRAGGEKDQPLQ